MNVPSLSTTKVPSELIIRFDTGKVEIAQTMLSGPLAPLIVEIRHDFKQMRLFVRNCPNQPDQFAIMLIGVDKSVPAGSDRIGK